MIEGIRKLVSIPFRPVTLAISYLWLWIAGPIIEKRISSTVYRVMEMMGTGLNGKEFEGAHIVVSARLGVSEVFQECFRNELERAIKSTPFHLSERDANRYAFLLDNGKLPTIDKKSHHLYGSLDRQGVSDRELLQTALVIDERLREAVAAVGLVHSTYYGDDEIISSASRFICTGNI
jgi:hypothetical protein